MVTPAGPRHLLDEPLVIVPAVRDLGQNIRVGIIFVYAKLLDLGLEELVPSFKFSDPDLLSPFPYLCPLRSCEPSLRNLVTTTKAQAWPNRNGLRFNHLEKRRGGQFLPGRKNRQGYASRVGYRSDLLWTGLS